MPEGKKGEKETESKSAKTSLLHGINGFIELINIFPKNLKSVSAWVKVSRFPPQNPPLRKRKKTNNNLPLLPFSIQRKIRPSL